VRYCRSWKSERWQLAQRQTGGTVEGSENMKNIIIKGKSDKTAFEVSIPQDELVEFLTYAIEKSAEEYDEELATSPGGFPTALFTCIMPHTAREETGWALPDGWNMDKAKAAFNARLERKSGGGGFSLETRQATWDKKAEGLKAVGLKPEDYIGKRPEAKV